MVPLWGESPVTGRFIQQSANSDEQPALSFVGGKNAGGFGCYWRSVITDFHLQSRRDSDCQMSELPFCPQEVTASIYCLRLSRMLHSPSLVAIGLSVVCETWPPIGWHHSFVIGWFKYRLGLPNTPLHYGRMWPVGIPIVFQTSVTVSLHRPDGRQMPVVRAVQGDCERV